MKQTTLLALLVAGFTATGFAEPQGKLLLSDDFERREE